VDVLSSLLQSQRITEEVAQAAQQKIDDGFDPEAALLSAGVTEDSLRNEIAELYGVPAFKPEAEMRVAEDVLSMVSEESARHYNILPLKKEDDVLIVGANDPDDLQIREVLSFVSTKYNVPYKLVFILKKDMQAMLAAYESLTGVVGAALTSLESELDAEIAARQKEKNPTGNEREHIEEDAPVTKIVATILRYAVDGGASDIHIEPFQGKVRVRFRVDGLLQTSLELPANVQSAVVARVKILSSMRLDERRKPQDGRFSATFDGRKIDFRVSLLPTNYGEKVVMRILDTAKGVRSLEGAGISEHNLEIIRRIVKEPYGIILISGPTGSGKSTTLYAMLGEVDKLTKNVLSLEDPVEYNIDGVSQSQVRPEIGYTFAAGLRSALRQDPDIILVGEIRDKETAQLAIQAALTGHLVFSTIHTNNSIGVVPRLIDMGVDPFLIAPTLKLAVAQRLARRICPGTGKEMSIDGPIEDMIKKEIETLPAEYHNRIPTSRTVLHPEPSPSCASGTKGRVAITECLEVTPDIEAMILRSASEEEIYQAARKNGFMSMKEDAIVKALDHTIPFEEVGAFGTKVGKDNVLLDEYVPLETVAVPEMAVDNSPERTEPAV
jgi:type IV pilus assembly protein PilB